jgi:formylglycine-generating enzyme required for sulfatase activity
MAKNCINPACGKEIPSSATFCPFCGAQQVEDVQLSGEEKLLKEVSEMQTTIQMLQKALLDAQQNSDSSEENGQAVENLQKQLADMQNKNKALQNSAKNPPKKESKSFPVSGWVLGLALLLVGGLIGYFAFYKPSAIDRDTYVSQKNPTKNEINRETAGEHQRKEQKRTSDNYSSGKQQHPTEPEMVMVQGGTFTMGCDGNDCKKNEKPAHSVTLNSFQIGKYEVTQAQWKYIMKNNPSRFREDDFPVENVNLDDVQEYISRLNASTGKNYRLPTEAEWEYAACGGNRSRGYKYSGSNNVDDVAWFDNNSSGQTHPVGTKKANELGIYDMSGNVWEWCLDWYDTYSASPQQNPMGASAGYRRVNRGGGWNYGAIKCRITDRDYDIPDRRSANLGFRVVLP